MVLYFEVEDGVMYSVYVDLDWLEEYATKLGFGVGYFLETYTDEDVNCIINAMDCAGEPYTIQEEHSFSGFTE